MFEELKKQLRTEMKAKLAALSAEQRREKSAAILARLLKRKAYMKASTVMAYASFGTEVETNELLARILQDGKTLVLPRLNPFDKTLVPHVVTDLEKDLSTHKLGFREPLPSCPVARLKTIELVLVPGLAFDEYGNRLGRGLGCYDRLIFEAARKTRFYALAYELQILGDMDLPQDVNDMPVDMILTESRRIDPNTLLDAIYQENKELVDSLVEQSEDDMNDVKKKRKK